MRGGTVGSVCFLALLLFQYTNCQNVFITSQSPQLDLDDSKQTSRDASAITNIQELAGNKENEHLDVEEALKSEDRTKLESKTALVIGTENNKGIFASTNSIESDEDIKNNNKQLRTSDDRVDPNEKSSYSSAFASASSGPGSHSTSFAQANAHNTQSGYGPPSPYGNFFPNSAPSSAKAYAAASSASNPTFIAPPSPYSGFGSQSLVDAFGQPQADYGGWSPFVPSYPETSHASATAEAQSKTGGWSPYGLDFNNPDLGYAPQLDAGEWGPYGPGTYPGQSFASANAQAQIFSSVAYYEPEGVRRISHQEYIIPRTISGQGEIVCRRPGDLYNILTLDNRCLICTCSDVLGQLMPVCVGCDACFAVQEPELEPEPLPLPIPVPQLLPEPQPTCSPLPDDTPFQNPFNPCQICICAHVFNSFGQPDIQIDCQDKLECQIPPDITPIPPIPEPPEPVPMPLCEMFPSEILFPHPTESCKICKCVVEILSFGIPEHRIICIPTPDCEQPWPLLDTLPPSPPAPEPWPTPETLLPVPEPKPIIEPLPPVPEPWPTPDTLSPSPEPWPIIEPLPLGPEPWELPDSLPIEEEPWPFMEPLPYGSEPWQIPDSLVTDEEPWPFMEPLPFGPEPWHTPDSLPIDNEPWPVIEQFGPESWPTPDWSLPDQEPWPIMEPFPPGPEPWPISDWLLPEEEPWPIMEPLPPGPEPWPNTELLPPPPEPWPGLETLEPVTEPWPTTDLLPSVPETLPAFEASPPAPEPLPDLSPISVVEPLYVPEPISSLPEPLFTPEQLSPAPEPWPIQETPELQTWPVPIPETELLPPIPNPLPWPPVLTDLPPSPLPGPPPHESCRPYPPNMPFQHPWDECKVCVCSEFHATGVNNIEVNCYTKPSCCYELPFPEPNPEPLPLPPPIQQTIPQPIIQFEPQSTDIVVPQVSQPSIQYLDQICQYQDIGSEFINAEDVCKVCTCQQFGNYVAPVCRRSIRPECTMSPEPKCRYRLPNQPFVVDCNLCSCQPVFNYVIARCTQQANCAPGGSFGTAEANANAQGNAIAQAQSQATDSLLTNTASAEAIAIAQALSNANTNIGASPPYVDLSNSGNEYPFGFIYPGATETSAAHANVLANLPSDSNSYAYQPYGGNSYATVESQASGQSAYSQALASATQNSLFGGQAYGSAEALANSKLYPGIYGGYPFYNGIPGLNQLQPDSLVTSQLYPGLYQYPSAQVPGNYQPSTPVWDSSGFGQVTRPGMCKYSGDKYHHNCQACFCFQDGNGRLFTFCLGNPCAK